MIISLLFFLLIVFIILSERPGIIRKSDSCSIASYLSP